MSSGVHRLGAERTAGIGGRDDDPGTRGELLAEAHSRLSSPLYALVAMALALSAILGGAFSRTGYTLRIAKAAALFLLLRVIGYGLVAGSAWNASLNVLQYVVPIVAVACPPVSGLA